MKRKFLLTTLKACFFFFLSYQPFLSPKTQQKQIREQMVFIYETKTSNKILKYVLVDEFVRNQMKLR